MHEIIWTDYLRYRADLRGFDLAVIEHIVRFSEERYLDSTTERMVAVGRHGDHLIVVPYERDGETVTPVTVHVTTRQQISLRLRTGRFQP